jgi:MFS superfamily sulfate permease-like transporter
VTAFVGSLDQTNAWALGVGLMCLIIIIAVVLSILQFFERAWRPHSAVLGHTDKLPGYHDVERHPDAKQIPGLLMVRWDAPLFFANANLFRQRIRDLLDQADPPPTWVLITAEPVTDIDTTAAEMLADLDLEMTAADLHLAFAELKEPVQDKIVRYGLLETIDRRHFYLTIEVAVAEFYREQKGES